MGKKAKVAEAIPVPHDGVIHSFWSGSQAGDEENEVRVPAVSAALTLLSMKLANESSSPTQRLWHVLTTATQNRDQLQALQAYRNIILLRTGDDAQVDENLLGTYRMLLELSLSYMTNQPLRRAIQASLEQLGEIIGTEMAEVVQTNVVSTLWQAKFWANPLQSLFEALNYTPLKRIIVQSAPNLQNSFKLLLATSLSVTESLNSSSFYNAVGGSAPSSFETTQTEVELTTEIAATLKILLTHLLQQEGFRFTSQMYTMLEHLQRFLWKGITCSAFQPDGLSKLGVAYGQSLLVFWIAMAPAATSERAVERIRLVLDDEYLPPLNTICTVQGIAAVLPEDVLLYGSPVSLIEDPLASYLLRQCSEATDGPTRLAALRSLQTLLSRCSSLVNGGAIIPPTFLAYLEKLTQETLQVVMSAWENPPGRQVASAIPGLFNSLVDLIETMHPKQNKAASGIEGLVGRVLSQPVNRKGRYIALETLLPIVGARALIDSGGNQLISSLVHGVGDRAHTAGNIAALLGKILSKRREEMNEEAGLVIDGNTSINRKQRRKLEQLLAKGTDVAIEASKPRLMPEWIELWAPHFARGLLTKSHVRRKQVSAFCIPLLVPMVGGSSCRIDASYALSVLLKYLEIEYERQKVTGTVLPVISYDAETVDDIFLWAKLEIARQASVQMLVSPLSASEELRTALKQQFSEDLLRSSLTHSSQRVRLVAFAALEPVLSTYDWMPSDQHAVYVEMEMWESALPYAFKSTGKEFIASLLQTLTCFLGRLYAVESDEQDNSTSNYRPFTRFSTFVNHFLIGTIFVKQAAYPGTVAEKEQFAVSLLRCVISVASQDAMVATGRLIPKFGQATHRHSEVRDLATLRCITENLLSLEVLAAVVSLCHSIWDATRSEGFACLVSLVQAASRLEIVLPHELYDESVVARGTFLSSSPRQREADTGAMILAFVSCARARTVAQEDFLVEMLSLLKERIDKMRESLQEIMLSKDSSDALVIEKGRTLPLAHGLIQSVGLVIDATKNMSDRKFSRDTIVSLVDVCILSIQTSLSVVADVKDGETLQGMENIDENLTERPSPVPLNVNTGAIGANATFSSIRLSAEKEALRRIATQRVVIGSWLLTREACATLTTLITYDPKYVPTSVVGRAGQLLITTMTALKHQGAAYAAQKALQQIAVHCMSNEASLELSGFPTEWSERLILEISSTEKVRDSTLRRSTGYALGFLALMRSELSVKVFPRTLCANILARLVKLSLPGKSRIEEHAIRLGLLNVAENPASLFSYSLQSHLDAMSFSPTNDSTSRVHALNVLRLIILDAPLASQVAPFIGDCIVSSMIGYTDDTWAVRNSATMVFSAAMLRVVDSDKNALQKDETSSNAITAVEFFRQYRQLQSFLLAVLRHALRDDQQKGTCFDSSHSSVFPVLLLLARLQPVRKSGNDAASLTDCFVSSVLQSLSHKEHKVRVIASRALANIASTDPTKASHPDQLLRICAEKLNDSSMEWNGKHGALYAIHQILQMSPCPSTALISSGAQRCITELCDRSGQTPASCLAVIIEIQRHCLQHKRCFHDAEAFVQFCLECLKIGEHGTLDQIAGASTLCVAAGRAASELLSMLIWAHGCRMSIYAEQLGSLLTSDIIDTRLVATKTFKKAIYRHIDELLLSNFASPMKAEILDNIVQLLSKSLTIEISRKSACKLDDGCHPPTVRRMSRCLLECLCASRALGFAGLPTSELWSLAERITRNFDVQEVLCDDQSMGNALELMGFAFACMRNEELQTKALQFSSLVTKLNNPLGPWRIRHSVACAIDTSSLLSARNLPSCRFLLQREILKLLQDNDPDVRFVAACSLGERDKPSSVTAVLALKRAYSGMCNRSGDENIGMYLLTLVVERYCGLSAKMDQILAEMSSSETLSGTLALINVDSKRKIFEEEDPNTYEEPLLACHLAVSTLIARGLALDETEKECSNLVLIGMSLLKTLKKYYSEMKFHSIMNDITRQNNIFPDVQGVLLSCIVIVFLGGVRSGSLQEEAKAIVTLCGHTIHPDIKEALAVLASARSGDDVTRESLRRLCFLVPSGVRY